MLHKFNLPLAPTKEHYSENYLNYWFDIVTQAYHMTLTNSPMYVALNSTVNYRIAENVRGRKLSRISRFCGDS